MLEEKDIQAIAQLILASEERLRGEIGQVEERLRVEFHSKLETEIHASEERTRTGIQEEIRASEDRLRGEMGQVEDRLRTEFQSKLETEIRASEERLRTEFHSQLKEEIHASETRTHAYIESGVMKPIRTLDRVFMPRFWSVCRRRTNWIPCADVCAIWSESSQSRAARSTP